VLFQLLLELGGNKTPYDDAEGMGATEPAFLAKSSQIPAQGRTDFLYTQRQIAGEMAEWLKAAVC
jgi:hypothetical protein